MRNCIIFFLLLFCGLACQISTPEKESTTSKAQPAEYALAIHGGAGNIVKGKISAAREKAVESALNRALDAGEKILATGGSAMNAIQQAIIILENDSNFNAGKGAVFNYDGENEMDASFMDGKTQNAGAVGGVRNIKNPILAARAVMEHSPHVLLTGKGAEQFAQEQGIEIIDPEYFRTERSWNSLQNAKARTSKSTGSIDPISNEYKYGTVGAVALDKNGNLAAGTSTGGMTNKRYNRLGDSPIIGAATYADNASCAVSSTGHGEYFIRYAVAHDIAARMEYQNISLTEAADAVVIKKLVEKGGSGGIIAVDRNGNVTMPFNTTGMFRGFIKPGERKVAFYKN